MAAINVTKMGLATGLTLAVGRVGCIIVFSTLGREQGIAFLNTLLCGADVGRIFQMDMSPLAAVYGIVQIFILGWLFGALLASLYNLQLGCCSTKEGKNGACCH